MTLAHEVGHTLGMWHDFDTNPHRSYTCGPGKWKGNGNGKTNDIMNYGSPKRKGWSECSNEDFHAYYTSVYQNLEKFCLKGTRHYYLVIYLHKYICICIIHSSSLISSKSAI